MTEGASPKGTVAKWADQAMFTAEPMEQTTPKVYLLSMSADPLGEIASAAKMYKGEVVRSLAEITDAERIQYFDDLTKTALNAAFETVKFHFLIEGVPRSFTHQLVRQRTAVYFQESMRFAVIDESFADRVPVPHSLRDTLSEHDLAQQNETANNGWGLKYEDVSREQRQRNMWDRAVADVEETYASLVGDGMPAEEARGLLPTDILTRIHYVTDLRNLVTHAGNRLCTQAQFGWRTVFSQIAKAIREATVTMPCGHSEPEECPAFMLLDHQLVNGTWSHSFPVHMADQIADRLFRPICYQTGKCEFMASFDRACTIRDRVTANHAIGRSSSEWHQEVSLGPSIPFHSNSYRVDVPWIGSNDEDYIPAIRPAEWLLDDGAARS